LKGEKMNFNDIKDLCKEHNKLLEKTKIIEGCNAKNLWMRVTTPDMGAFNLGDEEIKLLSDYCENRGIEIENIMIDLLNNKK